MTEGKNVSAGMFFAASFAASVVSAVSLSPRMLGGNSLESLWTVPVSFLVTTLLYLPAYMLQKDGFSMFEMIRLHAGEHAVRWINLLYFAVYTYYSAYFLSFFLVFMENTLNPVIHVWLIAACIAATALYGAWKGFHTITRAGLYGAVLIAFCFAFMFLALTKQLRLQRIQMFSAGEWTWMSSALLIARRSTMMLDLLLFLPQMSGKKTAGFFIWNIAGHLLFAFLLLYFAGVLGAFASRQLFPVYALATMADLGAVQRLDMVFLVVWMVSIVLRLSLNFSAGAKLLAGLREKRGVRLGSMFLQGGVAVMAASAVSQILSWQQVLFSSYAVLYTVLGTQVLLPSGVLLLVYYKRRKAENR